MNPNLSNEHVKKKVKINIVYYKAFDNLSKKQGE